MPAIDDKLELATTLESSLTRASELSRHGTALRERDEGAVRSNPAWVGPLLALDSSGNPARVVGALTCELPAVLRARYADLRDRLDPLFDHRLLTTVRRALQDLGPGRRPDAHTLEAWRGDDAAAVVALDDVLWAPLDRVRSRRARRDDRDWSRARALTSAVCRASRTMTSQASSMTT